MDRHECMQYKKWRASNPDFFLTSDRALTGKYPPKIRMYSKYERRTDTRTYEDRRKLYEGVSITKFNKQNRISQEYFSKGGMITMTKKGWCLKIECYAMLRAGRLWEPSTCKLCGRRSTMSGRRGPRVRTKYPQNPILIPPKAHLPKKTTSKACHSAI